MCCHGRCCCTPVVIITVVLTLVGLLGLGFLGGGLTTIFVPKHVRKQQIRTVEDAVVKWSDASSINSWQRFESFFGYVSLSPGLQGAPGGPCEGQTLVLTTSCGQDVYVDEAARFQSVKQLAFCADINAVLYALCDYQVSFLVEQPEATINTTLAGLPDLAGSPGVLDIEMYGLEGPNKCSGKANCKSNDCIKKCRNLFNGVLQCNGNGPRCRATTYISGLGIKVAYQSGSPGRFLVDANKPKIDTAGIGAFVLPKGYTWVSANGQPSGKTPRWQFENMAFSAPSFNQNVTFIVRSSSDPYLAYMASTGGTGYFLQPKDVLGLGIALTVIGGVLLLGVFIFAAFTLYSRRLYSRNDKEPPPGCFKRMAWHFACTVYGPRHSSAVAPAPAQQQMVLQTQPVYPPYQYPPAYPLPPNYPPPATYPAPGAPAAAEPAIGVVAPYQPGPYPGIPVGAPQQPASQDPYASVPPGQESSQPFQQQSQAGPGTQYVTPYDRNFQQAPSPYVARS